MAVVNVEEIGQGWNGSLTLQKSSVFSAVYCVETNNQEDGPNVIYQQGPAQGLPRLGDWYDHGNDFDPTSTAQRIIPTRIGALLWNVVVEFGPVDLNDYEVIQLSVVKSQWAVEEAIYWGQRQGAAGGARIDRDIPPQSRARKAGGLTKAGMIINSAGNTLAPVPSRDESKFILRITRDEPCGYPAADLLPYLDTVNNHPLTIDRNGFKLTIQPLTGKMENIIGNRIIRNNVPTWRLTYEIKIDKRTWRKFVMDQGIAPAAEAGDPDGHGGTISLADTQKGNPDQRQATDKWNLILTRPQPFDGKGKLNPRNAEPLFLEYSVYKEISWTGLELDKPDGNQGCPKYPVDLQQQKQMYSLSELY